MSIRSRVYLFVLFCNLCPIPSGYAQDFDGQVQDPQQLAGKSLRVRQYRGNSLSGTLNAFQFNRRDPSAIQILSMQLGNRPKNLKPEAISALWIDNRPMRFQFHFPSGGYRLVDIEDAEAVVKQRLNGLGNSIRQGYSQQEHQQKTKAASNFAQEAIKKLGAGQGLTTAEGENVIVITDYPAAQRKFLLGTLDPFVPKLNVAFGHAKDDFVLPGKPIIATFRVRENLGKFQTEIVGNKSFGAIRAFYHEPDGHVVVSAEDDRSPRHMIWQASWGLCGAFAKHSHSDVELPAWIRVGLQQHLSDVLVPRLSNVSSERRDVIQEIRSGTLNGILGANDLPGKRQLVCKFIAAHLYQLNSSSFGQLLQLLKNGHNTDQALALSYGMNQSQLAASFGKSLGMPRLTP
ncbi:MAG: hypothetical protein ACE361_19240 [Aureliella sp.]